MAASELGPSLYLDALQATDVSSVAAIEGAHASTEELAAELRRPWSFTWVVKESEAPVAFLTAWHVSDELHVLHLATRADRRRRGLASALLAELLTFARAHRVRLVLLEVRRSNEAALALYRRFGFEPMRIRPRYYADDEDAVEMALTLERAACTPGT